jgi:hypothetical protein
MSIMILVLLKNNINFTINICYLRAFLRRFVCHTATCVAFCAVMHVASQSNYAIDRTSVVSAPWVDTRVAASGLFIYY